MKMEQSNPPALVRLSEELGLLLASEEDPARLWAEIHRLRAVVQGPAGYATWQDAAIAERARRAAGLQEVHAVQWYADGGRTRCVEVFEHIESARVFADHLPVGASAWVTSLAVRGAAFARAFATGERSPCAVRDGRCQSGGECQELGQCNPNVLRA
jgi:hypothetical protein